MSRAIYGLIGVFLSTNQDTHQAFNIQTPQFLKKILSLMASKSWITFSMSDTQREVLKYHKQLHSNLELKNEIRVLEFAQNCLKNLTATIASLLNRLFVQEDKKLELVSNF
jgi:hypothetical protein